MFFAAYSRLTNLSPHFKKLSKYLFYQFVAHLARQAELKFMNYGYAFREDRPDGPKLNTCDEPNRCSIQLYHHLTHQISLDDLRVVDIGCGRGGGLDYLKRYSSVKYMIGLDSSPKSLCLGWWAYQNQELVLIAGDAENLPFADESFDVAINIESSHCYSDMDKFLFEVRRVLRRSGYFLFADFRDLRHIELLEKQIEQTAMVILRRSDITANVLAALDKDHEQKEAFIKKSAPKLLIKLFREFAGCKGTRIYNRFKSGESLYLSYILRKA